jgi:hypothetical protein
MHSLAIFTIFFSIFLVSSLGLPVPLFPGNLAAALFVTSNLIMTSFVSGLVNGVFYGFLAWLVTTVSFKWIERALSKSELPEEKD